ncbi:MAG: glutaredoxin family protein [Candidatus Omnitrophica bacterium]|nr:glutaredoxin family protein [Candidatus Omnitrophota bacterium]MDD5042246.1 glutaredoxin family protein [Candidatus Omnitrophota bacterium]MDD5500101.1 glutaredoxin family protein [Candidatus Omnitrophota bacterium]
MAKSVKIYSSPTCPWCVMAKQFLKDNSIAFQDVDVSSSQQAVDELMQKTGQMGVPVLEIDGDVIVGFNKEKIKQSLGL